MNKKTKLIASVLSITVLASSIFTIASFGGGIFVRSRAENNYSVTFSRSVSTIESGSYGNNPVVISSRLPNTGVKVLATINDDSNTLNKTDIFRFAQSSDKSVSFSFEDNIYNIKAFQGILSLSFTYSSETYDESFKILLSKDKKTFDTFTTSEGQTTFVASDTTYRYLKIESLETSYTRVSSLTINYSCSSDYIEPEVTNPFVGTFTYTSTQSKDGDHLDVIVINDDGTGTFTSAGVQTGTFTWAEVEDDPYSITEVATNSHTISDGCGFDVQYKSKPTVTFASDYNSFQFVIYLYGTFGKQQVTATFVRIA